MLKKLPDKNALEKLSNEELNLLKDSVIQYKINSVKNIEKNEEKNDKSLSISAGVLSTCCAGALVGYLVGFMWPFMWIAAGVCTVGFIASIPFLRKNLKIQNESDNKTLELASRCNETLEAIDEILLKRSLIAEKTEQNSQAKNIENVNSKNVTKEEEIIK